MTTRISSLPGLLLGSALLLAACTNAQAQSTTMAYHLSVILLDDLDDPPMVNDPASIDRATIEGDSLQLTVSYGGGCKEHQFKLYAWKGVDESYPPVGHVFLSHDAHGDACEALISQALTFGLSTLRQLWSESFQDLDQMRIVVHEPGAPVYEFAFSLPLDLR